ncbi:MAG: hydrolase 1, exosortase A system-associated, partial [Gammaproteobacteria bacterium]|nr:hydrolase 1, exosortase A system-associated [Gammaproteobacteria bacterium]
LLARYAAQHNFACMRFDFRGSGDSVGERRGFEDLAPDITAAVAEFQRRVPELERVVLLGLCDGASAVLINAASIPSVSGLILLNPWVHTEGSRERARLRSYYPAQLLSLTFWKRLLTGKVRIGDSLKGLQHDLQSRYSAAEPFLEEMLAGMRNFNGPALVLLSQNDLTAQEFRDLLESSAQWRDAFAGDQVRRIDIAEANHTFSQANWREEVFAHCADFLQSCKN